MCVEEAKVLLKMKILLLTVLLAVHATHSLQLRETEKVLNITLYYESLCPFCVQFITEELWPAYQRINSHVLIDFVPYGNTERTQVNGKWVYECQHGPDECVINKIEACGLAKITDPRKQVAFVYCVEKLVDEYSDNYEKLAACGGIVGSRNSEILKCAQGPEGDELYGKLAEKQSRDVGVIGFVPRVTFNGKYFEDDALENFLQAACEKLKHIFGRVPKECSKIN